MNFCGMRVNFRARPTPRTQAHHHSNPSLCVGYFRVRHRSVSQLKTFFCFHCGFLKVRGTGGIWRRRYDRGMESEVTAFVLAGGKSTRMGTDKAFVLLDGRTLLARMLAVARSLTPQV